MRQFLPHCQKPISSGKWMGTDQYFGWMESENPVAIQLRRMYVQCPVDVGKLLMEEEHDSTEHGIVFLVESDSKMPMILISPTPTKCQSHNIPKPT